VNQREISLGIIASERGIPKLLEGALSLNFNLTVSFKTSNVLSGVKDLKTHNPMVLLLDLSQIREERIGFLIKLELSHPNIKILVIADKFNLDDWLQLLRVGVRGVLENDFSTTDLSNAVWVIYCGGLFFTQDRMETILEQCAFRVKEYTKKNEISLSHRESQVLKLFAEGDTAKKVAALLKLSPKTIDVHKANLMRRINIHNRTELIKYALRKKIISLQED